MVLGDDGGTQEKPITGTSSAQSTCYAETAAAVIVAFIFTLRASANQFAGRLWRRLEIFYRDERGFEPGRDRLAVDEF